MQQARDIPGCLRILEEINTELQAMLEDIHQAHSQYEEKTRTRKAMQQWMKPTEDTPPAAVGMYLNDQFGFYRDLIEDMMAVFTGSERTRCVSFALSVDELLFMIRILLDEQLMGTKALKPIFLFLSRYARTTGSDTLSYESLRKKYSRSNPSARRNVRQMLAHMMARAEQYEK